LRAFAAAAYRWPADAPGWPRYADGFPALIVDWINELRK
jgi:hypothetical protein